MHFIQHHLAMILVTALVLSIYASWWRRPPLAARIHKLWLIALILLAAAAMILEAQRFAKMLPPNVFAAIHGLGMAASLLALFWWIAEHFDRLLMRAMNRAKSNNPAQPSRRQTLALLRGAVYAAPAAAFGYGAFIERQQFQTLEIDLPVVGLPRELEGLRIVQITDLHMGAYLGTRDMERIVGMANDARAHLAVMTGDLITEPGDPVDECIRHLSRVKTDAGMIGCLGNHEAYADIQRYVKEQSARFGIDFLRSEHRVLRFGGRNLNFAGVDYQPKRSRYLKDAELLIEPNTTNILLSHSPDVFPVAAAKGFAATLAGHTHGGQITVEYLRQYVNPARFFTRYVSGLYTEGKSSIYVSRGLGTVGLPVRLGATPELTIVRLRVG
jgi:uncharacterized protein